MTPTLNLLVLRVADPAAAMRFYAALGITFVRERHGNGPEHFSGLAGTVLLELYPAGEATGTRSTRLGFAVSSIATTLDALLKNGGTVLSTPQNGPWSLRAVVADPDGHRVELAQQKAPYSKTLLYLRI
ncbi:MAG: VOC family protein [Solimonas sp.]